MKKVRGIWITNVDSQVLDSRENIEKAMRLLAQTGFNVVFPVVWWGGYTLFKSKVLVDYFPKKFEREEFKYEDGYFGIDPRYKKGRDPVTETIKDRDPLQEVIDAAKRHHIKVIPWFEFGFGSSNDDSLKKIENGQPDYILETRPDFAAKNMDGSMLYSPSQQLFSWMNPFNPNVQAFIKALIVEVCSKYDDIDGIQGDERLPAFPSTGNTKYMTRDDVNQSLIPNDSIREEFLQNLEAELKELPPSQRIKNLFVDIPRLDPIPNNLKAKARLIIDDNKKMTEPDPKNGGLKLALPDDDVEKALIYLWTKFRAKKLAQFLEDIYTTVKGINKNLLVSMAPDPYPDSFTEKLQDYETWFPMVDLLHPQLYKFTSNGYQVALRNQAFAAEEKEKIAVGIRLYDEKRKVVPPEFLGQCMQFNRTNGINGEAFFFFDWLGDKLDQSMENLAKFFRTDLNAYQLNQLDDEGPDVVKIQLLLKEQGYYTEEVNGVFDQHTETAVQAFQQAKELDERGVQGQTVVGPKTLHQLGFGSSEEEALIAFGQYLPWEAQH